MENAIKENENKTKKNNSLIIVLILVIIGVISVLGYVAWKKWSPFNEPTCCAIPPKEENVTTAELNKELVLAHGQTGIIDSENLKITFAEVPEDDRCPTDVDCAWAGRVVIKLHVVQNDKELGDVKLILSAHGPSNEPEKRIGNYMITLLEVDPVPKEVGDIITSMYQIGIKVTKI